MISATIVQPELAGRARPGIRFGLIEYALAPSFLDALEAADPELLDQLRLDLAAEPAPRHCSVSPTSAVSAWKTPSIALRRLPERLRLPPFSRPADAGRS